MPRKIIFGLILLFLLFPGQGCELPPSFVVDGYVKCEMDIPLEGVRLELLNRTTYTDERGWFRFWAPVPASGYAEIKASKDGYKTEYYELHDIREGDNRTVTIYMEEEHAGYGQVSGHIQYEYFHTGSSHLAPDIEVCRLNQASQQAEYHPGRILVGFCHTMMQTQKLHENLGTAVMDRYDFIGVEVVQVPAGKTVHELIDMYLEYPEVLYAEPDYLVYAQSRPDDEYFHRQWHYGMINLPAAWDLRTRAPHVKVAVLDTGIIQHPDLFPHKKYGWGNILWDLAYDFVEDDHEPIDTVEDNNASHGTHVAGIIGALTNNREGVAGMAWEVGIIPIRVLNGGAGSISDVILGIEHAVSKGAHIINMSLGTGSYSDSLWEACNYAYNNDVTLIAAAGNNYGGSIMYPAAYQEVVAVGAVGPEGIKANYSAMGSGLEVMAPGGRGDEYSGVLSTSGYQGDPGYYFKSGTSMACAHVAGIAALLIAEGRAYEPDGIRDILIETASNQGSWNQYTGYGTVDAFRALTGIEPLVFAGVQVGEKIYVLREDIFAGGRYSLDRIPSGSLEIFAWIDVNDSDSISAGDYFARSGTIYLYPGQSRKVDLTLEKLTHSQPIKMEILEEGFLEKIE